MVRVRFSAPQVNMPEETIPLNIQNFFISQTFSSKSPIDEYYRLTTEIVKLTKPEIINDNPVITQLIILGYVSAVEGYLRSIFREILSICPYARSKAASKTIRYGALDYYEFSKMAEALFDTGSFASLEETRKKSNELLGMEIKENTSIHTALINFNQICHLRHCAIHSNGTLNAHNAKELGLKKEFVNMKLQPSTVPLQEALSTCHSFVRSFNQFALNATFTRWIPAQLKGDWRKEKKSFIQLIDVFWSKLDLGDCSYNQVYRSSVPTITNRD